MGVVTVVALVLALLSFLHGNGWKDRSGRAEQHLHSLQQAYDANVVKLQRSQKYQKNLQSTLADLEHRKDGSQDYRALARSILQNVYDLSDQVDTAGSDADQCQSALGSLVDAIAHPPGGTLTADALNAPLDAARRSCAAVGTDLSDIQNRIDDILN